MNSNSLALKLILALLTLLPALGAKSAQGAEGAALRVSLITCWPGPEIYELCGHEAIRVTGPDFDDVWNYGTFDFNEPNFIGRFVSGQTDYKVVRYPFAWFIPEYQHRGSRVAEQELLLSDKEKEKLLADLERNVRPENATYRYNYVRDNCATRIIDMIDTATTRKIIFPDTLHYGTFRREMRAYHKNYPWYQLGIDLVLGSGLDRPINRRGEMFVPLEMMRAYEGAHFANDGGPVAGPVNVLVEGRGDATLAPTPFWLSPLAVAIAMMALTAGSWLLWWRRMIFARWWFSLYFFVCGLAGCLVAYLVFFSSHEATSPNLLLIWLNPLQLLPAICVWSKRGRLPALIISGVNVVAVSLMLIAWPTQPQSASPAIFLMAANAPLLGLLYAIISTKISYNNNVATHSASKRGTSKRGAGKATSATKTLRGIKKKVNK